MPEVVTIKLNKEFKRAFYQGRFKSYPLLVTYRVKNRAGGPRCGISASKKIGCAVRRNRARRLILTAYRSLMAEGLIHDSFDYVFVARADTPAAKMQEVRDAMKKQILFLQSAPGR